MRGFLDGNIAIVLLGDGLETLSVEITNYCDRLKAVDEVVCGKNILSGFDIFNLKTKAKISEFWKTISLPCYKLVIVISCDVIAAKRMTEGIIYDARMCSIIPQESQYARTRITLFDKLETWYIDEGSCVVLGICLANSEMQSSLKLPLGMFYCEADSVLQFLRILILHVFSNTLICLDYGDLYAVLGSGPIAIEESSTKHNHAQSYTVLRFKRVLGTFFVVIFECTWEDFETCCGDTDVIQTVCDTIAAQAPEDDNIVFFAVCEPVCNSMRNVTTNNEVSR